MGHKYVIANWKMNHCVLPAWTQAVAMALVDDEVSAVLCPSYTQLAAAQMVLQNTPILLGAQDCHTEQKGAHTGDISAEMLKRSGCSYVIVGHSERRDAHYESDEDVLLKAQAALAQGLSPIICIGELDEERADAQAQAVVSAQIELAVKPLLKDYADEIIIAYEPIWAIGTGKVPTIQEITQMHELIKKMVGNESVVVYGGSVKPDNAREILALESVDGVLVGGASLDAQAFANIIRAAS